MPTLRPFRPSFVAGCRRGRYSGTSGGVQPRVAGGPNLSASSPVEAPSHAVAKSPSDRCSEGDTDGLRTASGYVSSDCKFTEAHVHSATEPECGRHSIPAMTQSVHACTAQAPDEPLVRAAMHAYTSAASTAVPAIGPSLMVVLLYCLEPDWEGTRVCVGKRPTAPQYADGTLIEPPASFPSAKGTTPAPTIAALPAYSRRTMNGPPLCVGQGVLSAALGKCWRACPNAHCPQDGNRGGIDG
jgi:hypothetical protein